MTNTFKMNNAMVGLIIIAGILILANQILIGQVTASLGHGSSMSGSAILPFAGAVELDNVDVNEIKSTAQGVAVLFPVGDIKTTEDAIGVMIPTGTPSYGEAMGVSYDDPVGALTKLARAHPALDAELKKNPELYARYINLAAEPRGVSCEFCCGVGPTGVTKDGRSKCGCKHNPAVLSITLWLLQNTDYNDAEILQEVYKWKSLFFPKNMVELATQIAGGDTSVLADLPGMVGGC